MKVSITFPSVMYREGPGAVQRLIQGVDTLGFDELNVLDHVVMGYPAPGRSAPVYPPQMPILEALSLLSYAAAVTDRVGLSTSVLVLPQRQPVLAAKQLSTIDTLSNGRLRVGIGTGWQASEYHALDKHFGNRGRRVVEAVALMRECWSQPQLDFAGDFYTLSKMAMEPKPDRGRDIPVWIGGTAKPALRRVAEIGDGWMGMNFGHDLQRARQSIAIIQDHAAAMGRNPADIGLQMSVTPRRGGDAKRFYGSAGAMAEHAKALNQIGFEWLSINLVELFRAGFRSVDEMLEQLNRLQEALTGG